MATRKSALTKWWKSDFVQTKAKSFAAKFPIPGMMLTQLHEALAELFLYGTLQRDGDNWFITDSQNRTFKIGGHRCDCGETALCIHRLTANFAYWLNLPIGEEAHNG